MAAKEGECIGVVYTYGMSYTMASGRSSVCYDSQCMLEPEKSPEKQS